MFEVYGITTYNGNDGSSAECKSYDSYETYKEAMNAGCKLVWTGKADSYEIRKKA